MTQCYWHSLLDKLPVTFLRGILNNEVSLDVLMKSWIPHSVFFLNMMVFIFLFCFLRNRNQLFSFVNILLKKCVVSDLLLVNQLLNNQMEYCPKKGIICQQSEVSYLTFENVKRELVWSYTGK